MNRAAKRRHHAFSLIEILVVIAIISLLIALLIPGLSASRKRAKTSMCQSHLKAMGTALGTYASEYSDRLPAAEIYTHETQLNALQSGAVNQCDLFGYGWAEELYEYQTPTEKVTDYSHFPVQRNYKGKYGGIFSCPTAEIETDHAGQYRVYLPTWSNEVFRVDDQGRFGVMGDVHPRYVYPRINSLKPQLVLIGDSNEKSNSGDYVGRAHNPVCSPAGCPMFENATIGIAGTPMGERFCEANQTMTHCDDPSGVANSFAHRHQDAANYLFGDMHVARDKEMRQRLACDWNLDGVYDPINSTSAAWSACSSGN